MQYSECIAMNKRNEVGRLVSRPSARELPEEEALEGHWRAVAFLFPCECKFSPSPRALDLQQNREPWRPRGHIVPPLQRHCRPGKWCRVCQNRPQLNDRSNRREEGHFGTEYGKLRWRLWRRCTCPGLCFQPGKHRGDESCLTRLPSAVKPDKEPCGILCRHFGRTSTPLCRLNQACLTHHAGDVIDRTARPFVDFAKGVNESWKAGHLNQSNSALHGAPQGRCFNLCFTQKKAKLSRRMTVYDASKCSPRPTNGRIMTPLPLRRRWRSFSRWGRLRFHPSELRFEKGDCAPRRSRGGGLSRQLPCERFSRSTNG